MERSQDSAQVARTIAEWTEETGPVLWWKFPIDEPPYVGTPLDLPTSIKLTVNGRHVLGHADIGGWPGYHTHWTPIPIPGAAT